MPILYQIRSDGSQVARWELSTKPLAVGRGECADVIVEDDALSHSHFLIDREGPDYLLIDLNSTNGTWVNDKRVSAYKLRSSEIIMAGESLFCFSEAPISTFVVPHTLPLTGGTDAISVRAHTG
jgi:pSer/pThr/pTyr-binding forkhead associated (FHA) protein